MGGGKISGGEVFFGVRGELRKKPMGSCQWHLNYKNSHIEVFMWCIRDFLANLNKPYDLPKKVSEKKL